MGNLARDTTADAASSHRETKTTTYEEEKKRGIRLHHPPKTKKDRKEKSHERGSEEGEIYLWMSLTGGRGAISSDRTGSRSVIISNPRKRKGKKARSVFVADRGGKIFQGKRKSRRA